MEKEKIPEKRKVEETFLNPFDQLEQWVVLKAKKRKLEKELVEVNQRIGKIEKEYPLIGNVKGMIKKQEGKDHKEEEEPEAKKKKIETPVSEKDKKLKELEKKEEKEKRKTALQKIRESPETGARIAPSPKDKKIFEEKKKPGIPKPIKAVDFMEEEKEEEK